MRQGILIETGGSIVCHACHAWMLAYTCATCDIDPVCACSGCTECGTLETATSGYLVVNETHGMFVAEQTLRDAFTVTAGIYDGAGVEAVVYDCNGATGAVRVEYRWSPRNYPVRVATETAV